MSSRPSTRIVSTGKPPARPDRNLLRLPLPHLRARQAAGSPLGRIPSSRRRSTRRARLAIGERDAP